MNEEIDVRHVLPPCASRRSCSTARRSTCARRPATWARGCPGARVVELPGADHLPWEGDQDDVLDEIERFLGDLRRRRRART